MFVPIVNLQEALLSLLITSVSFGQFLIFYTSNFSVFYLFSQGDAGSSAAGIKVRAKLMLTLRYLFHDAH